MAPKAAGQAPVALHHVVLPRVEAVPDRLVNDRVSGTSGWCSGESATDLAVVREPLGGREEGARRGEHDGQETCAVPCRGSVVGFRLRGRCLSSPKGMRASNGTGCSGAGWVSSLDAVRSRGCD